MEASEIIANAISRSETSSIHKKLQVILNKLESNTLAYIINIDKNQKVYTVSEKIRAIVNANLYHNKDSELVKINNVSKIIFTVTKYLKNGVFNGDVKAILTFLSVNCYLQLEVKNLLSKDELRSTYKISREIIKLLTNVNLTTQTLPDAPFYQKEMVKASSDGFSISDIAKTYLMIEEIERGMRGFHFNFLLENLISFLYNINFKYFIKALHLLKKPTDFVFYFQSLKDTELLKIANESSLSDKWLNFELIRQIIEKENHANYEEKGVIGIYNLLGRIKVTDFDFLKQTIIYFHKSNLFNASLGRILRSVNRLEMKEVISECFTINEYTLNLNSRDTLRENFIASPSVEKLNLLLTLIFNKWKVYFENAHTNQDFYQNQLLLTDFANFVIHYHTEITDNNSLISLMNNLVKKIKFIDSEWTKSISQQRTKFHLYHSELFLLTYAYKNKKLDEPKCLLIYSDIINNTIQLSRYASEETISSFNKGKINLS